MGWEGERVMKFYPFEELKEWTDSGVPSEEWTNTST